MRRSLITAVATALVAVPAFAALPDGTKAPDFSTEASLAGKAFKFSLHDALKKSAVVLYFYPAAFTPRCTVEAHEFAEATERLLRKGSQYSRHVAAQEQVLRLPLLLRFQLFQESDFTARQQCYRHSVSVKETVRAQ